MHEKIDLEVNEDIETQLSNLGVAPPQASSNATLQALSRRNSIAAIRTLTRQGSFHAQQHIETSATASALDETTISAAATAKPGEQEASATEAAAAAAASARIITVAQTDV